MTLRNHQEVDVTVIAVASVEVAVDVGGAPGFIDHVKHRSWWEETTTPPEVGDKLHSACRRRQDERHTAGL